MARIELVRKPKKGPATYRIRVFNGSDPRTGRKNVHTEMVVGEKEAKARAAELEKDKADGILVRPSKEALSAFLTRWLKDEKEGRIRARTLDDYRGIVARYIEKPSKGMPRIGAVRLDRLKGKDFRHLYTFMWSDLGLSPRTIQYLHSVLRQALGWAVEERQLGRNPTDGVKPHTQAKDAGNVPDESEEEAGHKAMSEEQVTGFLGAAAGDRYYPLWVLLATTGCRPGEALGLLWRDVDLKVGTVHIRRALTRRGIEGDAAYKLVPPKTKRGVRQITLSVVAVNALKEWRSETARERLAAGPEYEDKGFVFCNPFGKPLEQANLYARNFRRTMAEAKLGEWQEAVAGKNPRRFLVAFSMYSLRHTAATLLLKKGIHVKVVSEMLGHSKVSLTLDTYSHVLPGMQSGAAEAMDSIFGGPSRVSAL